MSNKAQIEGIFTEKVSLLNCNYLDQVTVKHTVYLLQSVVGVFSPGAASFFLNWFLIRNNLSVVSVVNTTQEKSF